MKQASAYCHVCERRVLAQGRTPNHILHLILTCCTFGLWAFVWVFVAAFMVGGHRCTKCGTRVDPSTGDAGRYGRRRDEDDDDD